MKRAAVLLPLLLLLAGCGSSPSLRIEVPPRAVRGSIQDAPGRAISSEMLDGMSFPTARIGYLVTGGGRLLRTGDGGRSWRWVGRLRPAILDFLTPGTGFALTDGGRLLATEDSGVHWRLWRRFHMSNPGIPFAGTVDFVDRAHGWVVPPSGWIYRTEDGGRSWARLGFHPCFAFAGLSFLDAHTGFAGCTGQPATIDSNKDLYETRDGGSHWRLIGRTHLFGRGKNVSDIPLEGFAEALDFRNAREGFLVAGRVGIYVTRNGARSWGTALGNEDEVYDTAWPSPRIAYALIGQPHNALLRSTDGARHWKRVYPRNPGPPTEAIAFRSSRVGIGSGSASGATQGAIVGTHDGGRTWTRLSRLPGDVQQLDWTGGRSFLAHVHRIRASDLLFRSRDEARSWTRVPTPRHVGTSWMDVAPGGAIFLYNDHGTVLRSQNGGKTWEATSQRAGVGGLQFISKTEGFGSNVPRPAQDSKLLHTTDGGRTWARVTATGLKSVGDIYVLDRAHWWLWGWRSCRVVEPAQPPDFPAKRSCGPALELRTSDAGRHWQAIRLPHLLSPGSYQFLTPRLGYAIDYDGILRTTDGGRTWRFVKSRLLNYR